MIAWAKTGVCIQSKLTSFSPPVYCASESSVGGSCSRSSEESSAQAVFESSKSSRDKETKASWSTPIPEN